MSTPASFPAPSRLIQLLGLVSLICGVLIVAIQKGTLEPIRRNQAEMSRENIAMLIPGAAKRIAYGIQADGNLTILEGDPAGKDHLEAVYGPSGALLGVVWEATERGYGDIIRGMFAYDPATEKITGFRAVELKETPGLGDRINTDPAFQANFRALDARLDPAGKVLAHPIGAVKHGAKKNDWEIDAISGATVSSRAVGRMLDRSAGRMIPLIRSQLARIQKGI